MTDETDANDDGEAIDEISENDETGETDANDETGENQDSKAIDDEFEPVTVFPEGGDGDATPGEGTDLPPGGEDLRPGADDCYKCSTCDTVCPVAEVDADFPGPKFQGPEQWRLKRREDHDVDDSIAKCSNCMRCDSACPSDVPLSQMHNTARSEYVDEHVSVLSRRYWRDRLLANYGTLANLGSAFPRLTNAIMGNTLVRRVAEAALGITAEREFPAFATATFREWYDDRGGEATSTEYARRARRERGVDPGADKRVAYFHGDYANHNTPEVGKALVRLFESFGYAVLVPPQRCSGTPMFANGMLDDARRAARVNVDQFGALVEDGVDVVCSCTSCSLALRQEYPELFEIPGTAAVAANTYDAVEYLRIHESLDEALARASDATDGPSEDGDATGGNSEDGDATRGNSEDGDAIEGASEDGGALDDAYAYHTPCHARNQGLDGRTVELLGALDGVDATDVGESCSGISGTYGWKTEHYETSMAVGDEMFAHMTDADATTGLTECPTCAMQMEHGTGYDVEHTLEVLAAELAEDHPPA